MAIGRHFGKEGVDVNTVLAIALYFIIWWLTLFVVMPFWVRTQEEDGEVVPGTPQSAPTSTPLVRIFLATTVVSLLIFSALWLAISNGWVTAETFDFSRLPVPP